MIKDDKPFSGGFPLNIDYAPSKIVQNFIAMFEAQLTDYMPDDYLTRGWNTNVEARLIGIEGEGLPPEEEGKFLNPFFVLIRNMPLVKLPPVFSTDIKQDSTDAELLGILDYKLKIERESALEAFKDSMLTDESLNAMEKLNSMIDTFDIIKYTFVNKNDESKFVRMKAVFYDKATKKHVKVKDIFY